MNNVPRDVTCVPSDVYPTTCAICPNFTPLPPVCTNMGSFHPSHTTWSPELENCQLLQTLTLQPHIRQQNIALQGERPKKDVNQSLELTRHCQAPSFTP
jgi:hypothetical protein